MNNKKRIFVSLRDSIIWIVLTSFIGLIQIVLYLMVALIVSKQFDSFLWFRNGAIVTFSLALVSSIFFDTHFQRSHMKITNSIVLTKAEKPFDSLVYKLVPWLVVLMVTFTTMLDILIDGDGLNRTYLQSTQIAGVTIAYIYTLYFKYCSFYVGLTK